MTVKRYSNITGAMAETTDGLGNPAGEWVRTSDYDQLERELAAATTLADALEAEPEQLPCGHSGYFAYSEDRGKHIVCLLCCYKSTLPEGQPNWVSVKDHLPPETVMVLAWRRNDTGGSSMDFAWQASCVWSPDEPWAYWLPVPRGPEPDFIDPPDMNDVPS